jgi:hypothetical protein
MATNGTESASNAPINSNAPPTPVRFAARPFNPTHDPTLLIHKEMMSGEEEWAWMGRSDQGGIRRARAMIDSASASSEFCGRDTVLIKYLKEYALLDADWILTVHSNQILKGFALVKKRGSGWGRRAKNPSKSLHKWVELDVVCAWGIVGLGTRILREVERHAAANGAELVELHSVPNAISFYRSRGYVNAGVRACNEDPAVTEAALMTRILEKRFKTPKEALSDAEYRRFLQTLDAIGSKAGTLHQCRGIGLKHPQCSFYGYRMNRCLSPINITRK